MIPWTMTFFLVYFLVLVIADNLWLKVSATLQDRPRADRFSVSCFYKNPYKPYIF